MSVDSVCLACDERDASVIYSVTEQTELSVHRYATDFEHVLFVVIALIALLVGWERRENQQCYMLGHLFGLEQQRFDMDRKSSCLDPQPHVSNSCAQG